MNKEGIRRTVLFGMAFLLFGFASMSPSAAGEPWSRIEEDWELRLNQPEAISNSPQITIYMTPNVSKLATYFQLQLNHAADVNFSEGGFRVSAIVDETALDGARSGTQGLLTYDGDIIRWTSVMAVRDNQIYFAIKDGTSMSWGDFGGPEYLLSIPSGEIKDLSGYTPKQSIKDVDIGFGRNRIEALTLKRVRAFREDGSSVLVETAFETF